MLLLGYDGMPRRYAEYLPQYTSLHQVTTVGAFLLFLGGVIFVWNMIQSWFEGPKIEGSDPWNLRENNLVTQEWTWFRHQLDTAVTDDSERSEVSQSSSELQSDGGQEDGGNRTADLDESIDHSRDNR